MHLDFREKPKPRVKVHYWAKMARLKRQKRKKQKIQRKRKLHLRTMKTNRIRIRKEKPFTPLLNWIKKHILGKRSTRLYWMR